MICSGISTGGKKECKVSGLKGLGHFKPERKISICSGLVVLIWGDWTQRKDVLASDFDK